MKLVKAKTWMQMLAAVSLLTTPLRAQAGGVFGGTETTEDLVAIPRLQVNDLTQITGYELFAQKMALLKQIQPDLEASLEKAINGKTWYHVPAEFDTLKNEQEKFHFTIKTPVYQTDRQIFLSDNALAKMAPEDGANMLMQEAFEAMQGKRDSQAAVILVGKVFKPQASSKEIQAAAFAQGFGLYLTPRQKLAVKFALRSDYLAHQQEDFEVGTDCSSYRNVRPLPPYVLERTLKNFNGDDLDIWSGVAQDEPTYITTSLVSTGQLQVVERGLEAAVKQFPQEFSPEFVASISAMYPNRWKELGDVPAVKGTLDSLGAELRPVAERETAELRRKLVQRSPLVDVLAIQYKQRGYIYQLKDEFIRAEDNIGMPKWNDVLDLVKARLHSVPNGQRDLIFKRVCDDSEQMVHAIKDLRAEEKEKAAYALGNKPAPSEDSEPAPLFHLDDGSHARDAR
jgi:hypothetical protein